MTVTPTIAVPELSRSTPDQEAAGGAAMVETHKHSITISTSAVQEKRDQRKERSDSTDFSDMRASLGSLAR